MRHVILAAALWLGTGPALVHSVHAFLHERRAAHVHEHGGDADHGDRGVEHKDLLPGLAPALPSAGPSIEALSRSNLAFLSPALSYVEQPRAAALDHGPPSSPAGFLIAAAPSNRAPPA